MIYSENGQIASAESPKNSGNSTGVCIASVIQNQPSGSELQTFSLEDRGQNTSESQDFTVRQQNDEQVTESEVKTSSDSNARCAAGVSRGGSHSYASGEQATTKIVQENAGDIDRVAVFAKASGKHGASSAVISQQGSMAFWKTTGPNAQIESSIGEESFFSLKKRAKNICKSLYAYLPSFGSGSNEESSVDRVKDI